MVLSSLGEVEAEVKKICEALDGGREDRFDLASRAFHMIDAVEDAGPGMWAHIDWHGFLRAAAAGAFETGAFEMLAKGKCLAWACEAGLLAPSFCFEEQKLSPFEQMALRMPNIAISTVADPRHWGLWLDPRVEGLGLDNGRLKPRFAACLSDLPAKGFEPPKLVDGPALGGAARAGRDLWMRGVGAALDNAESDGMLEFFRQTGRLEPWAVLCMVHGNEERLKRAIAAWADLPRLTFKQSWQVFVMMSSAGGPGAKQWSATHGTGKKTQQKSAFAWDAQLKRRVWAMAAEAGMPLARCEESEVGRYDRGVSGWMGASAWLARVEIERGGLRGQVAMGWLLAAGLSGMEFDAFGGSHPIIWGLGKGLSIEDLTRGALMDAALRSGPSEHGVSKLLIGLADLKATLSGPERGECADDRESLLGRLMHIGASGAAVEAAIKIGVDWRAANGDGDPPLRQLFALNRAGGYEPRLAAMLAGVGKESVGELLGQKAKDGSGPMHWAARALCSDSIKLLHGLGLDANGKDEKGATAGHWAARKYGAGKALKISAALSELTRCGQDWKGLDFKGTSALAALCAKGPLAPVEALLEKEPLAMEAKGRSGKSAKEALIARGPHAAAIVERAEISGDVGEARGGQAPGRPKRPRI